MGVRKHMTNESQVLLFEAGIKPAILVNGFGSLRRTEPSKRALQLSIRLSQYPFIDFPHRGVKMYFQDQQACMTFLRTGTGHTIIEGQQYLDYRQDVLGLALGFPPSAVNFFSITPRDIWRDIPKMSINYYGIEFVCHRDDTENCLAWCNKTYPIPEHLKTKLRYFVRDFSIQR